MNWCYTVRRNNKTKSVVVGSFETMEEAEAAMLKHYKATPKRGSFYYSIWKEKLEVISGVAYRSTDLSKPSVKYTREMLEAMVCTA